MKFTEDSGSGRYRLRGYGEGWIDVDGRRLEQGFILGPDQLVDVWGPAQFSDLRTEHLEPAFALDADIILIGTGRIQQLPTPAIYRALVRNGTRFELMTTAAACRTYQVLQTETRTVVALLFPN
ncbi:MAG: MTH938/NDUFAF3 family protein [Thiolinea sp.]